MYIFKGQGTEISTYGQILFLFFKTDLTIDNNFFFKDI